MIKIIPILLALTASSYNYDSRGVGDRPSISGRFSNIIPIKSVSGIRSHIQIPSNSLSLPISRSSLSSSTRVSSSSISSSNSPSSSEKSSSSMMASSSISSSYSSSSLSSSSSTSSSPSSSSSSSQNSSSPSSSSNSEPTPDASGDYLYCDECGPFSTSNENVTFTYELHSIPSQTIIERVRFFINGSVVSATGMPSFSYTNGQRKSVTFTIPIHDYLTSNGLQMRFEILNSSRSILKAYATTFYPPNEQSLSGYALKHDIYTSKSVGFYGDGSGLKELKDTFDFTTIGDYIDNDYYYRLDIGKNLFNYWGSSVLSCQSINLRFNDDEYLFPNIQHEENGDIVLPLSITRNGSEVSFKYKNQFYVDRRTLDSSDTYKTDYILTSDFYLPINGLSRFNGKTIYLDFSGLGLNKISASIPLKYELNRTIVGLCTDGDYCVIGGNQ